MGRAERWYTISDIALPVEYITGIGTVDAILAGTPSTEVPVCSILSSWW